MKRLIRDMLISLAPCSLERAGMLGRGGGESEPRRTESDSPHSLSRHFISVNIQLVRITSARPFLMMLNCLLCFVWVLGFFWGGQGRPSCFISAFAIVWEMDRSKGF